MIQKSIGLGVLSRKKVLHLEQQFESAVVFCPLGSLKWIGLEFVFCEGIAYINAAQIFAKCVLIFFFGQWNSAVEVCVCVCVCVYTHVLREETK